MLIPYCNIKHMYECSLSTFLLLSFKQGLKTLGVLEKIQTYPEAFYSIFCHKPESLSAKMLRDLFTVHTCDAQSLGFWNSYLQAVEGMWMFFIFICLRMFVSVYWFISLSFAF